MLKKHHLGSNNILRHGFNNVYRFILRIYKDIHMYRRIYMYIYIYISNKSRSKVKTAANIYYKILTIIVVWQETTRGAREKRRVISFFLLVEHIKLTGTRRNVSKDSICYIALLQNTNVRNKRECLSLREWDSMCLRTHARTHTCDWTKNRRNGEKGKRFAREHMQKTEMRAQVTKSAGPTH